MDEEIARRLMCVYVLSGGSEASTPLPGAASIVWNKSAQLCTAELTFLPQLLIQWTHARGSRTSFPQCASIPSRTSATTLPRVLSQQQTSAACLAFCNILCHCSLSSSTTTGPQTPPKEDGVRDTTRGNRDGSMDPADVESTAVMLERPRQGRNPHPPPNQNPPRRHAQRQEQ